MVYKKYIKKNGKLYGPYYYHSRRVNGKVVSEYRGGDEESSSINYKKFVWPVLGVLFLALIVYAAFNFNMPSISGNAVMDLGVNYQEGETLKGQLDLFFNEGELIPLDTKVIFETNTQTYEYELKNLTNEEFMEGNYYVSEKSISGEGIGFGKIGVAEEYPIVYFTLNIYSSSEEENETINDTLEPAPGLPDAISNFFLALTPTGNVALNLDNVVEGQVSYGNNFVMDLEEGQTIELIPGSVHTDKENLSDNSIDMGVAGGHVAVITSYSEEVEGFGESYLGDKKNKISIDLDDLGMVFDKGTLNIKLVYGEEELVSVSTILDDGNIKVIEEPILTEKTENTTETTTEIVPEPKKKETVPIVQEPLIKGLPSDLTDSEKQILETRLGADSIEVTKAKEGKNKITVKYELGNYWFEATYDVALSKEELADQMNADKTKWLRDVSNALASSKPIEQEREDLIGNYTI